MNLSYGGRSSFSNTRYRLNNFDTSDGASVFSPERSNAFTFSEDIQALYLNTVKQFSDRWEAQFGLRAEFAQTVGTSPEDERAEPLFTNNYGQLFPTFYVQYTQNDDHVYSFNYGKRINRPAYSQLNPARSFLSAQSSQQGNPFLLPSFSHNVEFAYVHRGNLTATLTFQYVKDAYSFIFDLDDANQEQIITYRNVYDQQLASLQLRYQLDLAPWWTTRLFFYGDVNQSDKINPEDNLTLDGRGRYYLSSNNQFTLHEARNISGEINFWYDSPYRANLYRFGRASALNVALNWRSFLPGADLTVGVYDVLNTSPRTVASTINGIEHNFRAFPSNRYLRFSLAYRFGNENIRADGRDFGNEEVRQRSN
ncbi:MAG: outer membrane beta-barrel family protein [Bacteroidota bacterium]